MRFLVGGIAIEGAAAVIGWLDGAYAGMVLGFFGIWALLVTRVAANEAARTGDGPDGPVGSIESRLIEESAFGQHEPA